jgi:hypothetical protein
VSEIPTVDWTEALLNGFGAWLMAQGVARFAETGPYPSTPAGKPPLALGGMPANPDLAYAVTAYSVSDDPNLSDSVTGLQVISRGTEDRRIAQRLDDAVFNVLHGARSLTWGGVPVVVVVRRSGTSLGQDGNRRWEHVSNYWATVARPTLHRVD